MTIHTDNCIHRTDRVSNDAGNGSSRWAFAGRAINVLAFSLSVLIAGEARAVCTNGAIGSCNLGDGCPGERTCSEGEWDPCEPVIDQCLVAGAYPGERTCSGGAWGTCEPTVETCHLGNGCPGHLAKIGGDWTCAPVAGAKPCTVCSGTGSQQCDVNGNIVTQCMRAEQCNFCDDDADGTFDEGLVNCLPPPGCSGSETCGDSFDNDCDGVIDDGCPIPPLTLLHSEVFEWLEWVALPQSVGDLTEKYWPKLAPPAHVIGGEVTHVRVDDDHMVWLCSGIYFDGDCQFAPGSSPPKFVALNQEVRSYQTFGKNDLFLWEKASDISLWPNDSQPADDDDGDNIATHVQGLAHDDSNWFISRQGALYQVPLTVNLADEESPFWTERAYIPEGYSFLYDHIGDIDQFDGFVFAPFERSGGGPYAPTPAVGIFNAADLSLDKVLYFPPDVQTRAGWVAINPVDGLLYSGDDDLGIEVYDWRGDLYLEHLYTLHMPKEDHEVGAIPSFSGGNGVAFSETGHMYAPYTVDSDDVHLMVFEVVGRRVTFKRHMVVIEDLIGMGWDALEGVDVLRTDNLAGKPAGLTGDVHMLSWNDDFLTSDNWTFINVAVDDPDFL